jgi:hypothetical protein
MNAPAWYCSYLRGELSSFAERIIRIGRNLCGDGPIAHDDLARYSARMRNASLLSRNRMSSYALVCRWNCLVWSLSKNNLFNELASGPDVASCTSSEDFSKEGSPSVDRILLPPLGTAAHTLRCPDPAFPVISQRNPRFARQMELGERESRGPHRLGGAAVC